MRKDTRRTSGNIICFTVDMRKDVVKFDGLSLGVLAAGEPTAPGLVLLHGWPHSKELYEPVIDDLATDNFVLAFDLPAIGDSRGLPRSSEKKDLAQIVIGAAEHLGLRAIVVAGLDVGGMIAYAAVRDHAQRISGAIVANTVIPGIDPWSKLLADPRIWHFAFHAIPELPELLVAGHQRAYFDYFSDVLVGRQEAVSEHYRATFARAYERPEALRAGFDWYRALKPDAEHNSQPKKIEKPLLYMRGDADGRSPDEYVRGLKANGVERVSAAVLQNSGELAPLEASAAFVREVGTFARSCRGS